MYESVTAGKTVARLYKTQREAQRAIAELRAAGFADVRVSERSGETSQEHLEPAAGSTATDFTSRLVGAGFDETTARRLTGAVEKGAVLITVPAGNRVSDAEAVFAGQPVAAQPLGPVDIAAPRAQRPSENVIQTRGEVMDIEKRKVQSHATVRREVVTEQRTITVPVQHEELVVERDGAEPVRIPVADDGDHPPTA